MAEKEYFRVFIELDFVSILQVHFFLCMFKNWIYNLEKKKRFFKILYHLTNKINNERNFFKLQ